MPRFCDSNIETDAIIGKGIDLDDLFDKRIVIEKAKIDPTKFPGKNAPGCVCKCKSCLMPSSEIPPMRMGITLSKMNLGKWLAHAVQFSPGQIT